MHYTEMSKSHLTLDYKILFEIGEFQKKRRFNLLFKDICHNVSALYLSIKHKLSITHKITITHKMWISAYV